MEGQFEAFFNMWGLQRSCDIQVATDSCGGVNPADSVLAKTEKLLQLQHGGAPSGQLEFDAMVRLLIKKIIVTKLGRSVMKDQASFTAMEDGTAEDYSIIESIMQNSLPLYKEYLVILNF